MTESKRYILSVKDSENNKIYYYYTAEDYLTDDIKEAYPWSEGMHNAFYWSNTTKFNGSHHFKDEMLLFDKESSQKKIIKVDRSTWSWEELK